MTIGPEPMTRTRLMSVRFGIEIRRSRWRWVQNRPRRPAPFDELRTPSSAVARRRRPDGGGLGNRRLGSLFHLVEKLPEQIVRVVRARRRLGVILHAEHRLGGVAQPF